MPRSHEIQFPVLATPKFDGIRCLTIKQPGGKTHAVSRKFKPIPNDHIRTHVEQLLAGLDGELMVRGRSFNDLSGDVRRKDGKPDFYYAVFDYVDPRLGWGRYEDRVLALQGLQLPSYCQKVIPVECKDMHELDAYEAKCLAEGYEGVMIRTPDSPYKCGRSTINEGYLLKIKRFEDAEATIIGVEEEMENQNIAERDAFGRTKRSKHQENMVPKGTMGKLVCKTATGVTFEIGTGYTAAMRQDFWNSRAKLIGKLAKYKHQPRGADVKPRFPVFLGFRDKWDL